MAKKILKTAIEVKDSSKAEEGNGIVKHIKPGSYVIALSEEGKAFSSIEFAKLMKQISDEKAYLSFVIGGPDGLSEEVKNRADIIISLSKMTFTHEMCRLFLIEQIYRASMINTDRRYHRV
ncbi:MAG: 23S rRNA (pseudouridine(1915)-N(3))-methyltransferase RlmH [Nanoarchaeota archaeon]|nr:23S rRNA (pseudouridine(1915)-N(3))-methyltransferase RlmH [Nanoarchaeota archaeon]